MVAALGSEDFIFSFDLFCGREIVIRANKIVFRAREIIFRACEIVFCAHEILFRFYKYYSVRTNYYTFQL